MAFHLREVPLDFGLDFRAESDLVGVESPNPGVLVAPVLILTLAGNNAANRFTNVQEPFRHAWANNALGAPEGWQLIQVDLFRN